MYPLWSPAPALPWRWLSLLALCGALLTADAAVRQRCTEVSEGRLEGEPIALEPRLVPPAERRHTLAIPHNEQTCGARGAAGVVVTACDVLPPQVELREAAGEEWGEARVLRLGPTWQPLLLELTLFCEPSPDTTAATTPAVILTTSSRPPPGPVIVPVDSAAAP